ncbi:hypothetical protein EX895_006601 [Sporisorium graminicola]|uniref:Uncharacterized protein n=1 Tax=Sporisorium graminicola TaxID=280036 RepID=A0A4V6ET21_9BASI|nr:hypothetical protein EX895_006601 [Sporisorium graminicola]TKY84699.1 hypothetical protein EX895_006601 [Sporisorium graminicola]
MAGYLLYIIFLSIGPNFIAAVNYISLSRFVWALGRRYSRVHPAVYSWGFILADIICTLVLGAGASWAALLAPVQMGERLMIGGLAGQAFCSLLFATLGLDYYLRRRRMIRVSPEEDQDGAEYLWYLGRAKICAFAYVTAISSVCLLTRACFRIVELSGGFNGTLARIEPLLFALDGVPVLIASTACTLVTPHPDFWHASRIAQQERPIQDHLPLKATYNLDQGL